MGKLSPGSTDVTRCPAEHDGYRCQLLDGHVGGVHGHRPAAHAHLVRDYYLRWDDQSEWLDTRGQLADGLPWAG